jgi:hypothetical protein
VWGELAALKQQPAGSAWKSSAAASRARTGIDPGLSVVGNASQRVPIFNEGLPIGIVPDRDRPIGKAADFEKRIHPDALWRAYDHATLRTQPVSEPESLEIPRVPAVP